MCAKSCNLTTSASKEGEFLHELEEKMEVGCEIRSYLGCNIILLSNYVPECLGALSFMLTQTYYSVLDRYKFNILVMRILCPFAHIYIVSVWNITLGYLLVGRAYR